MVQGVEKRRCHRFEVPGAKVMYKKTGLLVMLKGYSSAYPVVNVSKGGLAFLCDQRHAVGEGLMTRLLSPMEAPLDLGATVRWHARHAGSGQTILGVAFAPFGHQRGWNSPDALDVLRRLETQYGPRDASA
ncbi:MAG: hypothetical protein FJ272_06945 [Planctomycetes bacterium]|nr:hypothetical protein [Planctomycetota bacterium]